MKRFFSFMLCLCLCFVNPMAAFAAEATPVETSVCALPADYGEISPMATYSNSVTIPGGSYTNGNFTVKNPHTLVLTTNGEVTLQSSNPDARVNVIISGNATPIFNETLYAGDTKTFSTKNHAGEYVISYFVYSTKKGQDITLTVTLK